MEIRDLLAIMAALIYASLPEDERCVEGAVEDALAISNLVEKIPFNEIVRFR